MTLIFVDTGGWLALLNATERLHPRALAYYEARIAAGDRFLTTNYVVDETATRLRYDAGVDAALAFRDALDRSIDSKRTRVVWVESRLEREGWQILRRYRDVEISLTDAVSAAAARRAKVSEVFGFDAHFRALGFDVQPAR